MTAIVQGTTLFARVDSRLDSVAPDVPIAQFISLDEAGEVGAQRRGTVPLGDFVFDPVEHALADSTSPFRRPHAIPPGRAR